MKRADYDGRLHHVYDRGRSLAPGVVDQWMDALATQVGEARISRILDVGAGTGRFSAAMARKFSARVIAMEPSAGMLRKAGENPAVSRIRARAEEVPVASDSLDMALLSMVVHHFSRLEAGCAEVSRVLRPGGFAFVRNVFKGRLAGIVFYNYFPRAREIDDARMPSIPRMEEVFGAAGLRLESAGAVRQKIDDSLAAHTERMRRKAVSTLELIPEEEFEAGIRAMEAEAQQEGRPTPIYEDIDLLTFRKG
jgi:ubiquinone/menaquinone biosynthesis C-methylase UbiE